MRPNWLTHSPRIILDQNWMQFSCTYYNFLWQRAEAKLGESIVFLLSVGLPKFVFISAPASSAIHMGTMGWPWQLGTGWCLGGAAFHNLSSPILIHLWYRVEIVPNGRLVTEGELKSSLEMCVCYSICSGQSSHWPWTKPHKLWSFLSLLSGCNNKPNWYWNLKYVWPHDIRGGCKFSIWDRKKSKEENKLQVARPHHVFQLLV